MLAAIVLALTVTTLTPRTVIDTTRAELSKQQECDLMNQHSYRLAGWTPLGVIVRGSDTSIVVRKLIPPDPIYGARGWEVIGPPSEHIDTITFSPQLRIWMGDSIEYNYSQQYQLVPAR